MKPVHTDALLYVLIAVCGFIATQLGNDETYEMFTATKLWWCKLGNGTVLAGATALKLFRSTSFKDHLDEEASKGKQVTVTSETTTREVKPAGVAPGEAKAEVLKHETSTTNIPANPD